MKKKFIFALAAASLLGLSSCTFGGDLPAKSSSAGTSSAVTSHDTGLSTESSEVTSHDTGLSTEETSAAEETSHDTGLSTEETSAAEETSHDTGLSTEETSAAEETSHDTGLSTEETSATEETSHDTGLSTDSTEESTDTSEEEITVEIMLSKDSAFVGDKVQVMTEVSGSEEEPIIELQDTPMEVATLEINDLGALITCNGVGTVTISARIGDTIYAMATLEIEEEVVELNTMAEVLAMQNDETFAVRAYFVGGQTKQFDYSGTLEYKTLYFGTAEGYISAYNVRVSDVPEIMEPGSVVELKGTVSNVGGGDKPYIKHQFKLGAEGYIKLVDDATVTIPTYTDVTSENAFPLSADTMDKVLYLHDAKVTKNSVNASGNRSVTLKLGSVTYDLYFNGKYVDSDAWGEVNVNDKIAVAIIGDVNDYNGTITYQATAFINLKVTEPYEPEDPEEVEVMPLSAIDLSQIKKQEFTEHLHKAVGKVTALGTDKSFMLDDGSDIAVVYKSTTDVKVGDVVEVCGYVQNYYQEKEFAKNGDVEVIVKVLEGTIVESLVLDEAADVREEDDFAKLAANKDSRASVAVLIKGTAVSADELNVYGEKVMIKYASSFKFEVGVTYEVLGYLAGYNSGKNYFNLFVNEARPYFEPVTEITLNKESASIAVGESVKLVASANVGADASVEWTVESEDPSSVAVSVEDGLVTGLAEGVATVVATSVANPEISARCVVTVTATSGDVATAKVVMADYALANGWSDKTPYSTVVMDENITVTASGDKGDKGNNGKYYDNGKNWRLYQTENGKITIAAGEGYEIKNIKITYENGNTNGSLYDGDVVIASDEVYAVSAASIELKAKRPDGTNGQARISVMEVNYVAITD